MKKPAVRAKNASSFLNGDLSLVSQTGKTFKMMALGRSRMGDPKRSCSCARTARADGGKAIVSGLTSDSESQVSLRVR
jgi:hypothetical protein